MKVSAYKCNFCGSLKTHDEVIGIDIETAEKCSNQKTDYHFCPKCFMNILKIVKLELLTKATQ